MIRALIEAIITLIATMSLATVAQVDIAPVTTEVIEEDIVETAQADEVEASKWEASATFEIDYYLIDSVIYYESGGDAEAVSACGAMGLMQVMPAYCQDLLAKYEGHNLYNARTNIMVGSEMLAGLVHKYGTYLGLVAYNAGEYSQVFRNAQEGAPWEYADKIITRMERMKNGGTEFNN